MLKFQLLPFDLPEKFHTFGKNIEQCGGFAILSEHKIKRDIPQPDGLVAVSGRQRLAVRAICRSGMDIYRGRKPFFGKGCFYGFRGGQTAGRFHAESLSAVSDFLLQRRGCIKPSLFLGTNIVIDAGIFQGLQRFVNMVIQRIFYREHDFS